MIRRHPWRTAALTLTAIALSPWLAVGQLWWAHQGRTAYHHWRADRRRR